jgi:uncharacterized protein
MAQRTDSFDLGRLRLSPGEARRLDLHVAIDPFELAGERYDAEPELVDFTLDVTRMTGSGYSLRGRFEARLAGPCQRCVQAAAPSVAVDAREVDQPRSGEELDSPYVDAQQLDVRAWARDALALAMPAQLLCDPDCAGLCPECGENLNHAPGHRHEPAADARWAKLRELRLE